jgi:hypothetical protein
LAFIATREDILSRPRTQRIFPIVRLLLGGDYQRASGSLSAMKDLVEKAAASAKLG